MKFWIAIFLLCMVGTASAKDPEPQQLRYQYPENKQLEFKYNEALDMKMSEGSLLAQVEWKSLEMGKNETDSIHVEIVFTDIAESILIYNQLLQRPVMAMLNEKPFRFSITPRGNLLQFIPPKPGHIGFGEIEIFDSIVANIELSYANLYPKLPDHPVTVGDSWTATHTYAVPYNMANATGTIEITSTYTVKKTKKVNGALCFEIEEKSQSQIHMYRTYGDLSFIDNGTSNSKGKLFFDYERGLIMKYEISGEMEAETTVLDGQENPSMKSRIKLKSKRELKEIRDI